MLDLPGSHFSCVLLSDKQSQEDQEAQGPRDQDFGENSVDSGGWGVQSGALPLMVLLIVLLMIPLDAPHISFMPPP